MQKLLINDDWSITWFLLIHCLFVCFSEPHILHIYNFSMQSYKKDIMMFSSDGVKIKNVSYNLDLVKAAVFEFKAIKMLTANTAF